MWFTDLYGAHTILLLPSKIRTSRLFLSLQSSNFISMDLDKLSTNVRQPFFKILIGSVMASKQRMTEKPEELYLLSEVENKQSKSALL